MNQVPDTLILILGILIGCAIIILFSIPMVKQHSEIVKHGCAEYNSQTGIFTWIEKKKATN